MRRENMDLPAFMALSANNGYYVTLANNEEIRRTIRRLLVSHWFATATVLIYAIVVGRLAMRSLSFNIEERQKYEHQHGRERY